MSQAFETEVNKENKIKKWWQQGLRQNVNFCNLSILERCEPETAALFSQGGDLRDGTEVETPTYKYRAKYSARFGFSITRWTKTNTPTSSIGSVTVVKQQPKEQPQSRLISKELDTRLQAWLDLLKTAQNTRRDVDAIIVGIQQQLRSLQ